RASEPIMSPTRGCKLEADSAWRFLEAKSEGLVYWDLAWEQEIWPEGIFASISSTMSAEAIAGLARVAVRVAAAAISPVFAEISFGISALCHTTASCNTGRAKNLLSPRLRKDP